MSIGNAIIRTKHLQLGAMLDTDREEVLRLYIQANAAAALWDEKGGIIREAMRDAAWTEIHKDTYNCVISDLNGTFIGRVCMQHLSDDCPEVGIELLEQYRNQGFGPEALTAFITWFKGVSGKPRVKARIEQDNTHSQHIFEKLGAVYTTNDTALQEMTIKQIKKIMPEADTSELEIRDILVYYL